MEGTVKERLKEFIKFIGISEREFCRRVGVGSAYIQSIRKSIKPDTLQQIAIQFPNLNSLWLLTGEGEMLARSSETYEKINDSPAHGRDHTHMIPFYDAETTGGFFGPVASSSEEVSLKGYINPGDWFEGRETAAIRHCGESMTEYPDGCVLVVREVREFRMLVPGRNYVIETDEYRVTKRVQKGSTQDYIALYSSNQEKYDDGRLIYEPFEVCLSDVRRIFSILGFIVNYSGRAVLIRP